MNKSIFFLIVGWFLLVFFGLALLGFIVGPKENMADPAAASAVIVSIIFVVGGVMLIRKAKATKKTAIKNAVQTSEPVQMQTARCPGCGANNTVAVGKVSKCEYCDTPIDNSAKA